MPTEPPSARPRDSASHERGRELDRAHRGHVHGAARFVLSLRLLKTMAARLVRRPLPAPQRSVAHPPQGVVAVTFVGHATTMITTPGARILTDPLLRPSLYGLRRAREAGIAYADLDDTRLVLISHAHRDHLDRDSLRQISRSATVVVPPGCADLVDHLGFERVLELPVGHRHATADVEVTAVPVRHSGARGLGRRAQRRGAAGYIVASQGTIVYFAGDTGYFTGFADIGRRLTPDVALLPIAGYQPAGFRDEHLSPLDAIYAFEDLGARVLIPIAYGSFPFSYEPLDAPLAWLRRLARERHLGGGAAGTDDGAPIATDQRRVAALEHGETCLFRKRV